MPLVSRLLLAIAVADIPCSLAAQNQTFTPKTVLFSGVSTDPKALTALAAIAPGKPLNGKQIEDAMNRLADTGLFADVRYTVDDRALTFQLTAQPARLMLPVVYGNFVLWKPEELTPLVHARVPLFTGAVPTTGTFQQTVADTLTAIVAEKLASSTRPTVEFVLTQGLGVVYNITAPVVQIRQVHADAISAAAAPKLTPVLQSFASTDFDRRSATAIQKRLQDTYLDLGFLDIAIDPPTQSPPVLEPTRILIDFSATVHEGAQYHIAKIDWPASPILKPADFEKAITLRPGDPASRIEILSATKRAESQFTFRGYLDAKVSLDQQKDSAAHTLACTFTAVPGEQYHVKTLRLIGATPEQQKDLERLWTLTPGSAYDGAYSRDFMPRHAGVASFQGFGPRIGVTSNRTDHTVDLVVTMTKVPARPQ